MSFSLAFPSQGLGVAKLAAALLAGWALVAAPPARHAVTAAVQSAFPPAATLTVSDFRAYRREANGQTVLFVEGMLHQAGDKSRKAPGLKLALMGEDGRALYTWSAKVGRPEVTPGVDVPFQTRLAAPPEKFKSITIAFEGA